MHSTLANSAALLLAAAIPMASAQTYTTCNPLDSTCPADPAMGPSLTSDFTGGLPDGWTVTAGDITYGSNGAVFTISGEGDAPTIQTKDYFFFGTAEVKLQAAPGTGIVSSIVLESDDLDEIDWEALGSYTTYIENNYFGKGYTGTYNRSTNAAVSSPQTTFHTYTVNWQPDSIQWLIDGSVVRTLTASEAGDYFPQTPMRLRIGTWAGGDPNNSPGTITWAGGRTDYADGPFTAYVQSVSITNNNPGSSYSYNGNSGSADSIEVAGAYSASPTSSAPPATSTAPPPTSTAPPPTSTAPPPTSTAPPPTSTAPPPTSTAPPATSTAPPPSSADPPTTATSATSATSTSPVAETTTSPSAETTTIPSSTFSPGSTATSFTPSSITSPAVSSTFTSVVSGTPTNVVPPAAYTTAPSNTTTATGTGSSSGTSSPTATPAPQVASAMPTASVTSSAVALYCFLFAAVVYAL